MPKTDEQLAAGLDPGTHRVTAPEPGTVETVDDTAALLLGTVERTGAYLFNLSEDVIVYLSLSADGATVGEGIVLYPGAGQVISGYDGPISAVCETTADVTVTAA